jgi:hypothetical protein
MVGPFPTTKKTNGDRDGFLRRLFPPVAITYDDLDHQVDTDTPRKITDESSAASSASATDPIEPTSFPEMTPGQLEDLYLHQIALQKNFGGVMPKATWGGVRRRCGCRQHKCPYCFEDASLYYRPKSVGFKQR